MHLHTHTRAHTHGHSVSGRLSVFPKDSAHHIPSATNEAISERVECCVTVLHSSALPPQCPPPPAAHSAPLARWQSHFSSHAPPFHPPTSPTPSDLPPSTNFLNKVSGFAFIVFIFFPGCCESHIFRMRSLGSKNRSLKLSPISTWRKKVTQKTRFKKEKPPHLCT